MHVCVLGAGVVGLTTAWSLVRDGHDVTIVEARGGAALEASFANGGQLSYSYVAPLADPAVLPKLPAWLVQRGEMLSLGALSKAALHEIVERESIAFDYVRNGKLVVYRDPHEFERARRKMELLVAAG